MVLPHQISAAGMGGKDECVSQGSEHGDVKLPLFSACLAKCQPRRKENVLGRDTAEQGLCPQAHAGVSDPCLGRRAVHLHKVAIVEQSVGRASSTSNIALAPKHMCDSPNLI